jgi:hypothetical protein
LIERTLDHRRFGKPHGPRQARDFIDDGRIGDLKCYDDSRICLFKYYRYT